MWINIQICSINILGHDQSSSHQAPLPISTTQRRLFTYRERTRALLTNYIENLTVHGVSKIFIGNIIERVCWALVFFGVFAFFLIIVHSLFVEFNSHAYFTNTQLFEVDHIKLPSITVCDEESFLCSSSMYKNESIEDTLCDQDDLNRMIKKLTDNICCENMKKQRCNDELSQHHPGCVIINPLQNTTQDSPTRSSKVEFQFKSSRLSFFFHNSSKVPLYRD